MDPFVVIMLAVVGGLFLAVVLLGVFYPGSGADQLDWRPTRSAEVEYENEIDDLAQMQEAVNAKRRARGAAELTEEGLRAEVAADLRSTVERGEDALVEQDIAEMLELKNRRRAKQGLEPLTREELEREVLGEGEAPVRGGEDGLDGGPDGGSGVGGEREPDGGSGAGDGSA